MAKAARTMRTRMMNSPRSEINWRCKGTLCKLSGLACISIWGVLITLQASQPATRSAMVNDDDVRRRHLERRFLTVRIRVHTFCYVSLLFENPNRENQKAG